MAKQKPDPLSLQYGSSQPGRGVLLTPSQKAASPQAETELVKMDVLADRSYNGKAYHTGDTVDVPEEYVETLTLAGFAARADRVDAANEAREHAKARHEAGQQLTDGHPVAPLGTLDVPAEPKE